MDKKIKKTQIFRYYIFSFGRIIRKIQNYNKKPLNPGKNIIKNRKIY